MYFSLSLYMYIYIYIERERELLTPSLSFPGVSAEDWFYATRRDRSADQLRTLPPWRSLHIQ